MQNEKLRNAINNEIQKRQDLINVTDTVDLFNIQCRPKLIQTGDTWSAVAEIDGSDLSIPEAINKWLSRPEKANLLKINLTPGGGSTGGSKPANGAKTIKMSDFVKLSFAEQNEKILAGVTPVD